MTTIYQALNAVMNDVEAVGKGEWNDAPGAKYLFRGVDAVINAVGPALRKHGVIVVPELISSSYEVVTVGKNRTEMSSVRLQVKFRWYGPEGDFIESAVAAESFDSGDKATAKAHSVAYRTAIIETLCLATDDRDPDKDTYERSGKATQVTTDEISDGLRSAANAARADLLKVLGEVGVAPADAEAKFAADNNGVEIMASTNATAIRKLIGHYRKQQIAGRA